HMPTPRSHYTTLFRSGLIRETISAKEGIYFPPAARQVGTVDSEEKGFAYMFGEPSPIVPSLDVLTVVPKSPQPAYRKLNGSWYLDRKSTRLNSSHEWI